MTTETRTMTATYEGITCCRCDLVFLVPTDWKKRRQDDETMWWFCPNGHTQHYPGKSEEARLRESLRIEQNRLRSVTAHRDSLKFSVRAQKAAKTRLKNRIKNGVCPCCNRSFANLKKHIAGQHPDYAE